MSKGLEAIQEYKRTICPNCLYHNDKCEVECFANIIEKALERLEKIETTTHSVLKEEISKKLIAIEIIKEHGVDVAEIMICQDYVQYEARFCGNVKGRIKLTQEEFDLLKEVFL